MCESGGIFFTDGPPPAPFAVSHDESTFDANDRKRQLWMKDGKQPLRPKAQGKGLMVSDFPAPGGKLIVPDMITDVELVARLLPC